MGRGSTQVLIRRIVESLTTGPKTIAEIAEATGLDRTAIGKYVNILEESDLLVEEQEGTSKKFTLVPTYRTDTYFGLPLTKEVEQQINSVYYFIKKYWAEKTTKKLLGTHAQKIAFKVINNCKDLKIPSGWYIYGGISIGTFDETHDYNNYGLSEEVQVCIKSVVDEVAPFEYAWQVKNWQYQGASELYKTKEEILALLYGPNISQNPKQSLHHIIKKVRKLVSLSLEVTRKEYVGIMDAYQDLLIDIYNKLDDVTITSHIREIITLFEAIWKYIALFNFKQDLKHFYPEKILDLHFILDIKQQEGEILEIGTELQMLIPEEPLKKKTYDALSQIKTLTPKEQEKQKKELEELEKKLGPEKFQEYLLEKAGLK